MKAKLAAHFFHGKEGYNCAQAVLKAYQPESGMSELTIRSATVAGGGRAPKGVCGALYAAQIILGEAEASALVSQKFEQKTGSIKCSDIKQSECGCRGYVEIAAKLAMAHIDQINGKDSEYSKRRESREIKMLPQSEE